MTSSIETILAILGAMAIVSVLEVAVPLHGRGAWSRVHLVPNLTLTAVTLATNLVYNAGLVLVLVRLDHDGVGLLHGLAVPGWVRGAIAVVVLDFSFYVAHVAMHRIPVLWRVHRVHHCDPAVDVTTTIRQHPIEGVIRYTFMAAFAVAIGPSPAAFAVYRASSVLNGLLEHADIRMPLRLDRALSLVTTWPGMHKIHHARAATRTNTNYGNLFSLFDRALGTFTPVGGTRIVYGLDGFDDPRTQTTAGLIALPFRGTSAPGRQPTSNTAPSAPGVTRRPSAEVMAAAVSRSTSSSECPGS